MAMKQYEIVETPIEVQKYMDYVLHPSAGAVTVFTGNVREWTHGVKTLYLSYEAYVPMAEKKMAEIGAEMEAKWPGVRVAIASPMGSCKFRISLSSLRSLHHTAKLLMRRMNMQLTALKKWCPSGKRNLGRRGRVDWCTTEISGKGG